MNRAALKDIISIVVRLTVTCLLAGAVMGATFVLTHEAKERNEQARDERVLYAILGYGDNRPQNMAMHTVYRYVLAREDASSIGYVVPVGDSAQSVVMEVDLDGHFVQHFELLADSAHLRNDGDRDRAVIAALNAGMHAQGESTIQARYADKFIIATQNGRRNAYILDGKYPGFKTFIRVKMALDEKFSLMGFEVLEHEEDPGLGAEITQPWFRNQFAGKSYEQIKKLQVTRSPVPDPWMDVLSGKITGSEAQTIRQQHADDDIYALTGATISSRSVLQGNQAMIRKFVTRMEILDRVLKEQHIETPF